MTPWGWEGVVTVEGWGVLSAKESIYGYACAWGCKEMYIGIYLVLNDLSIISKKCYFFFFGGGGGEQVVALIHRINYNFQKNTIRLFPDGM